MWACILGGEELTQYFSEDGVAIDLFDDRADENITCTDLDSNLVRLGFPPFHNQQVSDQSQHT